MQFSELDLNPARGGWMPPRETLEMLGTQLMRRNGVAAVSAWRQLPHVLPEPPATAWRWPRGQSSSTGVPPRMVEKLMASIAEDVGPAHLREARTGTCEAFIALYGFYGQGWPLPALVGHLQWCGEWPEKAVEAWSRALRRYELMLMLK